MLETSSVPHDRIEWGENAHTAWLFLTLGASSTDTEYFPHPPAVLKR
jgi:hypothetical protein